MRRLIYASDLDRTLIYSRRFLEENPTDEEVSVVEEKDGKIISYMNKEAVGKLKELNEKVDFVPVTSRTIEQYNRIDFGFTPQYAITSCGGTILFYGEKLKLWDYYVKTKINQSEVTEIRKMLEAMYDDVRFLEELFFFVKVGDSRLDDFNYPGWRVEKQGKKYYVIPNHFSKKISLQWVRLMLKTDMAFGKKLITSGDSNLDVEILKLGDIAMIPDTSYLVRDNLTENFEVVEGGINSPLKMFERIEQILLTM